MFLALHFLSMVKVKFQFDYLKFKLLITALLRNFLTESLLPVNMALTVWKSIVSDISSINIHFLNETL